jgi:hypothetical protein
MKISSAGLEKIETRIRAISEKLNDYAGRPRLSSEQREDFRDLQDELRVMQRQYLAFADPDSGK